MGYGETFAVYSGDQTNTAHQPIHLTIVCSLSVLLSFCFSGCLAVSLCLSVSPSTPYINLSRMAYTYIYTCKHNYTHTCKRMDIYCLMNGIKCKATRYLYSAFQVPLHRFRNRYMEFTITPEWLQSLLDPSVDLMISSIKIYKCV